MQKLLHFPVRENRAPDLFAINRDRYIPETGTGNPPKSEVPAINNYLKSLEEIEAEFRTVQQPIDPNPSMEPGAAVIPGNEELLISMNSFALSFPEYMEENY
jgi:hypothetical protein